MASVTNIKVILNMSNYKVSIYDGENGETNYIDAGGRLDKSIWVPWIGTQDEAFKSLLLKTLDGIEYQCFIFQDYWRPPSVSPVKIYFGSELIYTLSNTLIDGDALYGGDRLLIIHGGTEGLKLYLVEINK